MARNAMAASILLIVCLAAYMTHAAQHVQDQHPFIVPTSFPPALDHSSSDVQHSDLEFRLRHVFHRGAYKYPKLHRRLDIDDGVVLKSADGLEHNLRSLPQYKVKPRLIDIERLAVRPSSTSYHHGEDDASSRDANAWTVAKVAGPDITDRETVLSFARMALDAYTLEPGTGDWQDVGMGYNYTEDFGWETDGLRGHIFADTNNKTVVIAMKGTSIPFVDPIGTIGNDKINDNLMFSCCCGQGGRWLWHQVCSCQTENKVCNETCLAREMRDKTRYYYAAEEVFYNVTQLYPHADIWLSGHSLGGAVASLVGLYVGQPVVTFEAPAEAMAAARLGLPTPPSSGLRGQGHKRAATGGYHFGHTADDIFMGNCNAWNSICTLAGYAMETKCHTGYECVYDTIKDKGWSPNARSYHSIGYVLKEVLEAYDKLPECKARTKCSDCEEWDFVGDGNTTSLEELA